MLFKTMNTYYHKHNLPCRIISEKKKGNNSSISWGNNIGSGTLFCKYILLVDSHKQLPLSYKQTKKWDASNIGGPIFTKFG